MCQAAQEKFTYRSRIIYCVIIVKLVLFDVLLMYSVIIIKLVLFDVLLMYSEI